MNNDRFDGPVSLGLMSLRAQLNTLLAEAGGDAVVKLLDTLCQVSPAEQKHILALFTRVIDKFLAGDMRTPQNTDELSAFEENLYSNLLADIEAVAEEKPLPLRLQVLQGGKVANKSVVHIEDLRKAREANTNLQN